MVSVIIPVYNTESYLEECIRSVVGQTYHDLEIIIINDGSTDRSGEICRKWEKLDQRIRYIEKENEGQGKARNLGIALATGEYIIFVDSDDYLDIDLVGCVSGYMEEQQADICVYGYNFVDDEEEIYETSLLFKVLKGTTLEENREILGNMQPFIWNKMYSATLVKKVGCGMSNHVCEDLVFNAKLYRHAKKICMLDRPFYYYRYNRNGNISTDYKRYMEIGLSIHELNQVFIDKGELKKYWIQLYEISVILFKDILLKLNKRTDMGIPIEMKNRYPEFIKIYGKCLEKCFSQYIDIGLQEKKYLLVGSYNLRVVLHCFLLDEDCLEEDYAYSSIVSLMSRKIDEKEFLRDCEFQNLYRKRCVEQDVGRYFCCHANVQDMDYVIIDFLDEILDVIKIGEDCYITDSSFLRESNLPILREYDRISFLSKERRNLFKKYLQCFIKRIKQTNVQVVMIKQFLCEKHSVYYDVFSDYENKEIIQEINQELEWYYQYFLEFFPETIVVDALEFRELVFTYDGFPFGCEPFYYNSAYYQRMAVQLNRCITGRIRRIGGAAKSGTKVRKGA